MHFMNIKNYILTTIAVCSILFFAAPSTSAQQSGKPRIILTIDPECDDNNSLIHFLLRATDFDVDGIIYASSRYHWKGNGTPERRHVTNTSRLVKDFGYQSTWRWSEGFIEEIVDAYGKVYNNLKVHDPNYPDPAYLKSLICYGNIEFEGDYSKDTDGSNLIKRCILDDEPGKLYVAVWGGASTVARALKSIEEEYGKTADWEALKAKINDKLVICMDLDQDGAHACYVEPVWPNVHIRKKGNSGLKLGYGPQVYLTEEQAPYYYPTWWEKHITSQGLLGSLTRVWGDGKQMVPGDINDCFGESDKTLAELEAIGYVDCYFDTFPKGSFLGEGNANTGSWLNLVDNGLRSVDDESWGGWTGRTITVDRSVSEDLNTIYAGTDPAYDDFDVLPDYMNSLAARYKWSATPNYADANHYPVISEAPLALTAKPGQKLTIKATVTDPDGDKVALKWWQFKVGSYANTVALDDINKSKVKVTIPTDAKPGDTIHVMLTATDDDTDTPLSRYHRVVITVE